MKSCAILGASGHGKVVAEIAELNGFKNIVFFDDQWPYLTSIEHWSVSGDTEVLKKLARDFDLTVIAIGHNLTRCAKHDELKSAGAKFGVLLHPTAVISKYANVGPGTVVMANAVISSFSQIGSSCIVNTASTIDHDCKVSDGVHISPGSNLAGGVVVGKHSWVGIGSKVKQLVTIGSNSVVGAGSSVIKDVADSQTVVGCPAQIILKSSK